MEQVRANAQLLDVATDTPIQVGRFDKPRVDVFTVQDKIAGRLIRSVQTQMIQGAAWISNETRRPEATDLFLQTHALASRRVSV
jgi:hypothetical protein